MLLVPAKAVLTLAHSPCPTTFSMRHCAASPYAKCLRGRHMSSLDSSSALSASHTANFTATPTATEDLRAGRWPPGSGGKQGETDAWGGRLGGCNTTSNTSCPRRHRTCGPVGGRLGKGTSTDEREEWREVGSLVVT